MLVDSFPGGGALIAKGREVPADGNVDAMDRWAEEVLKPLADRGDVDFSGPFLIRPEVGEPEADGPVITDWIIPAPAPADAAPAAPGAANPGARVE
jgi:hypothetical protein